MAALVLSVLPGVLPGVGAEAAEDAGVAVEAVYTADWLRNFRGGLETGSAYVQNVDVKISAPVGAASGATPGRVFAYLLYNDRTTFSDRIVGDTQVVSNIDAAEAARVYELWYERPFGERWSAKLGLYDLNSEFDVIDTAGLFLNSSHGIGAEYAQSGRAGPSIFPLTSLALRVAWDTELGTLRYALLDAVPGDPDDPSRTTVQLSGDEGVLQAVEWDGRLGAVRAAAGYWRYSAAFRHLGRFDGSGAPVEGKGNDGYYLLAEGALPTWPDVRWFARYGRADDTFNAFGDYLGLGLVVAEPFGAGSALGLAVARAHNGRTFRRVNPGRDDHETTVELTARFRLTPWLVLQPDVQYVVNPGTNPALEDALVMGFRVVLSKSRAW